MNPKIIVSAIAIAFIGIFIYENGTTIDSGNVGIVKHWNGDIDPKIVEPGYVFSPLSKITSAVASNINQNIDSQPKAGDNLTMSDFKISVKYSVDPNKIPSYYATNKQASSIHNDIIYPGSITVGVVGATAINDIVGKLNSMDITKDIPGVEKAIMNNMRQRLNNDTPNFFNLTEVRITVAKPDASVEESIRAKARAENQNQTEKALADAQEEKARGIAYIQAAITPQYVDYLRAQAMISCANSQHCTMLYGIDKPIVSVDKK